jgi:hypothetical protein
VKGSDLLAAYLARYAITPAHAASALVTTVGEIRRLLSAVDAPSEVMADRIEDWSGGAVPASSWWTEEPPAMTYREIGDELGLSDERVRQIESVALSKLRHNAALRAAWLSSDGVEWRSRWE